MPLEIAGHTHSVKRAACRRTPNGQLFVRELTIPGCGTRRKKRTRIPSLRTISWKLISNPTDVRMKLPFSKRSGRKVRIE